MKTAVNFFYIINLFLSVLLYGQQIPNMSPPPPDVHSLYKFSEIPVSHTTGVPNINVPIHEIKLKDFKLPISMNYHSSGIIIDEVASDVGLGWSLNAGGLLSQMAVGKHDYGNSYNLLPQDRALETQCEPVQMFSQCTNEDYYTLRELSNINSNSDIMDSQPDLYMFNAGNFSGKFFFDINNIAHTIPKSDIKIIQNGSNYIIIDEKGNKYFFETVAQTQNYSILNYSSNGMGASSVSNSFSLYLTKIETVNKDVIVFEYNNIKYKYKNPKFLTRSKRNIDESGLAECTSVIPHNMNNINSWVGFEFENNKIYDNYVEVTGKSIKRIKVNNDYEIIEFQYQICPRLDLPAEQLSTTQSTTGSFALKKIKISNKNLLISEVELEHKYFNLNNFQECITVSNDIDRDLYRLKLISVIKNNTEKYAFEYFENEQVPSRLSNNYDHWNRFKTNLSGVGDYVLDYTYSFLDGVDRTPYLNSSRLATLKKIIYPTKGYSEFEYALNKVYGANPQYSIPINKNESIFLHGTEEIGIPNVEQHLTLSFTINNLKKNTDETEIKPIIKVYSPQISNEGMTLDNYFNFYLINENNPSQISTFNFNNQNGQQQTLNISNGTYTLHIIGKQEGIGASISWIEHNNSQDNLEQNYDIGGLRIESIKNFSKNEVLETKTIYNYNLNDNYSRSSGIILNSPVYSFFDFKFRVCSIATAFNPALNSTTLSNNFIEYKYLTQQNKPIFPMNLLNGYHIMYPEVQVYNHENKSIGFTTYKYSYFEDDPSYHVNSGDSFNHTLPTSFICPSTSLDFLRGDLLEIINYLKTNNGFKKIAEKKYEYTHNELGSFFNDQNNNYRIGLKVEEYFRETVLVRLAGGQEFPDTKYFSLFNLGYYKYQSVKKYLSKDIQTEYDSLGNNPFTIINNYFYDNDLHNQLTSQTTTNSNGDLVETKYSYAHELNNTALINNNMIGIPLKTETFKNGVKLSAQETTYKNWGNNLLAPEIVKAAKGSQTMEDKIKYNLVDHTNGNPLELQQVDNIKICYIWGYNKTLPIAKIENATYASIPTSTITNLQDLSNTGTEANLILALNNLRTSLPNAMVTTFTHRPLVGVSTVTDPKGDKQSYYYDNFNRLQFVKDKNDKILSENQYHYKN